MLLLTLIYVDPNVCLEKKTQFEPYETVVKKKGQMFEIVKYQQYINKYTYS